MRDQIEHGPAFGRAVFRVRVVVVKTRAVGQHPVTFHLPVRIRPLTVLFAKLVFLFILRQARHPKPAHVEVGAFAVIGPGAKHAFQFATRQELHGLFDRVRFLLIFADDAVFRFDAQQRDDIAHMIDRLRVSEAA